MNRRTHFGWELAISTVAVAFVVARAPITVHASADNRAAGAAVYHTSGCEYCHGIHATGVADRGPDLSMIGKHRRKDDIAKQIANGGGGMPSFGAALSHDQVSELVDFLSAKKKAGQ